MDKLLSTVSELYNLSPLNYLEQVSGGFLSENHILADKDGRKYFLKRYRFDDSNKIQEIHSAKTFFSEKGIPAIMPLLTQSGETFFSYHQGFYALFPFVRGIQFERGELPKQAIISLGTMMGKVHLAGKQSTLKISDELKQREKDKFFEKLATIQEKFRSIALPSEIDNIVKASIDLKQSLVEKYWSEKNSFSDTRLPNDHLIHGDYYVLNVFFDAQNNVSHVFDYEKTQYAPRSYELFRSLFYSFFGDRIVPKNIEDIKLYFDSYRDVYPISDEEVRQGFQSYYIDEIHNLWAQHEHIVKQNKRVSPLVQLNHERVKYVSENANILLEILLQK